MPLAPRLDSTRGGASRTPKNVSTSRTGIEDATTSVASGGSSAPSSAARRGSLSSSPRVASIAAPARRSASVHPLAQALSPGAARRASAASVGGGLVGHDEVDDLRGVLPGAVGVEQHLHRVQAGKPRPQRLGRGQVADAHDDLGPGGLRRRPRRAAARRSGRSPPRRCARPTAGRPAAASPPPARRPRPPGPAATARAGGPAIAGRAPRGRPPRCRGARGPRSARASRRRPPRRRRRARLATHARPSGLPPPSAGPRSSGSSGRVEDERLAQRQVQVHRARPALERRPHGAAGQGAHPAQPLRRRLVHADLGEPLHRVAVELDLVDGLAGAGVAQLGRAVRGQHDSGTRASRASTTAGR